MLLYIPQPAVDRGQSRFSESHPQIHGLHSATHGSHPVVLARWSRSLGLNSSEVQIADQVSQGVLACKLRSDSLVLGKCGPLLLELFLLALRRLLRYGLRVLVVRLRSLLVIVRA